MKAIHTKYFGPRNKKGFRIIAKDGDGNKVEFGVRDDVRLEDNHYLAALKLCVKMNWTGTWYCGWLRPTEYVFVPVSIDPECSGLIRWHGGSLAEIGEKCWNPDICDRSARCKADINNL